MAVTSSVSKFEMHPGGFSALLEDQTSITATFYIENNTLKVTEIDTQILDNLKNFVKTMDYSVESHLMLARAAGGMSRLYDDKSPQLGGFLDLNGYNVQYGRQYYNKSFRFTDSSATHLPGIYSFAAGEQAEAMGHSCFVVGSQIYAEADYATAIGANTHTVWKSASALSAGGYDLAGDVQHNLLVIKGESEAASSVALTNSDTISIDPYKSYDILITTIAAEIEGTATGYFVHHLVIDDFDIVHTEILYSKNLDQYSISFSVTTAEGGLPGALVISAATKGSATRWVGTIESLELGGDRPVETTITAIETSDDDDDDDGGVIRPGCVCTNSDILLLVDGTGSMGPFINNFKYLFNNFRDSFSSDTCRWAVGYYRDLTVKGMTIVQPFTNDWDLISAAINSLAALGGGDVPEDNFDALKDAGTKWLTGLNGNPDHTIRRRIIWGGDAPSWCAYEGNWPEYTTFELTASALLSAGIQLFALNTFGEGAGIDGSTPGCADQASTLVATVGGLIFHSVSGDAEGALADALCDALGTLQ